MGRRGNNEGSIYKRKDGRWTAAITLGGRRISMYGKTRAEVNAKLKELQKQVEQGLTVHGAKYNLGDYLQVWLSNVKI